MQSCFHLDLALKLKGINIAMGGGGEGALRPLFRFGNRVLAGRGENSTECLNLFATACSKVCQLPSLPGSTLPTEDGRLTRKSRAGQEGALYIIGHGLLWPIPSPSWAEPHKKIWCDLHMSSNPCRALRNCT